MATPEQQDQAIFNSLQGKDASFYESISDDEASQLQAAVDRHKARMSSPGNQSSPGFRTQAQPVAPNGQSSMSGGIPEQAYSTPKQQTKQTNPVVDKLRSFAGTALPFIAPAVDSVGYLANEMTGNGNEYAYESYSLPQKPPGSAQEMVAGSMQRNPGSAIAGMMVGPKTNVAGQLPVVGKMAMGAGQNYIQGKVFQNQNEVSDGTSGQAGAVMGAAIPALGAAGGSLLDWASTKIAPKALQMMREMANQIIQSKAAMDPARAVEFQNSASQMGFKNKFDDILYTVIKYLSPQTLESGLARQGRMGDAVRQSGANVGQSLDKLKSAVVPSGDQLRGLGQVRDSLNLRTDGQSDFGPQAARIVQRQFMQTPQNIVNSGQSKDISLESIYNKAKAIKDGNFNPAYQVSNPKQSPLLAAKQVTNYALKKADYSPEEISSLEQANKDYSLKATTQQLLANNNARAGSQITQNSPVGQVRGAFGRVARQAGAPVVYKGSKRLAQAAMQRLDRRYGVGGLTDRSPFQVQMLKNKLQKISQMEPKQAATYAFAESMVNPMFRQIWTDVEDK